MYHDGIPIHGKYHGAGALVYGKRLNLLVILIQAVNIVIVNAGKGVAYGNGQEIGIQGVIFLYGRRRGVQEIYLFKYGPGRAVDALRADLDHSVGGEGGMLSLPPLRHLTGLRT